MNRESILMVVYDLPCTTKQERREYAKFCKALKSEGFERLQESVYYKYLHNRESARYEKQKIIGFCPQSGNIIAFCLPFSVFERRTVILGNDIDLSHIAPVIII